MSITSPRIAITGCGHAARVHLDRLLAIPGVRIVGCADPIEAAAEALARRIPSGEVPTFKDHRELLRRTTPDALAIFTPHLGHYRPAMDALQAGCHLFIEKPLSTNPQEAADIVGLARARGKKVAVGHQYRLRPSLVAARKRIREGRIGPLRLVTAVLAQPWLRTHEGGEHSWRFDPKLSGGGLLADAGDHLLDALLWTCGTAAVEASAVQSRLESGLDVVTAAALRLADGTPATVGLSGVSAGSYFQIDYHGETGRLRATDHFLEEEMGEEAPRVVESGEPTETIDANFVSAIVSDTPPCCPAEEALDTVRLLESIARSAATSQSVRLA